MNAASIDRFVADLRNTFLDTRSAPDGATTLVRIADVSFPAGCKPATTDVLVRLTPGTAQPELFVKVQPARPDGGVPRNVSPTSVAGESWLTYSFALQWDENRHTAAQFVWGRLARFGRNE